jgi:hypothetical protein
LGPTKQLNLKCRTALKKAFKKASKVAAAITAVAIFAQASPALSMICPSPVEQHVFQVRMLQTKLMVSALSCNAKPQCNSFIQKIRIFATGHTDMSGLETYNQNLSRQQLRTVHQALNERSITPELIDQEAFGKKRPRVTMPDGAPNSRNRRVEIIVGPAPEI